MQTIRTGRVLSLLLAGSIVIAASAALCVARAETSSAVIIKNFMFSPMALTVKAGSTVTWKNLDGEPHTVVSVDGAFRSPALDQNDTFKFTFAKPGVYKYVCTIHPKMVATITVK